MPYDNPPLPVPTHPSPAAAGARRDSYKVMSDYPPSTATTSSVQYTSSDYAMLNSQVQLLGSFGCPPASGALSPSLLQATLAPRSMVTPHPRSPVTRERQSQHVLLLGATGTLFETWSSKGRGTCGSHASVLTCPAPPGPPRVVRPGEW